MIKLIKNVIVAMIIGYTAVQCAPMPFKDGMYFATVTDTEHFPWVLHLIKSIHAHNKDKILEIAVFDVGLKQSEIDILKSIPTVDVYDLLMVNPYIKTKFKVRPNGRMARGWYTFKPVALYQALLMFPYVLYIDAGIEVKHALDSIFFEIIKKGYYLLDCGHSIQKMATQGVRERLELNNPKNRWILDGIGISAGIQGVSHEVMKSYIEPMFLLAHDIKNFEDDGTAPGGFGYARHDQTLFSIFAQKLGFKTHTLASGMSRYFYLRKHHEKDEVLLEHSHAQCLL